MALLRGNIIISRYHDNTNPCLSVRARFSLPAQTVQQITPQPKVLCSGLSKPHQYVNKIANKGARLLIAK